MSTENKTPLSAEEILAQTNNTEWDSDGNPVWHGSAVIQAMEKYASSLQARIKELESGQQEKSWVKVEEGLPQGINGKMFPVLVFDGKKMHKAYYFPEHFKTIEFEDWDDYSEEDFPYTEDDKEKGCVWLRPGFYVEQECSKCDEHYWSHPIKATHWMPLPSKPGNEGTGQQEREEAVSEAEEILTELCALKAYKDKVGKDAHYRAERAKAWERAKAFLQSKQSK